MLVLDMTTPIAHETKQQPLDEQTLLADTLSTSSLLLHTPSCSLNNTGTKLQVMIILHPMSQHIMIILSAEYRRALSEWMKGISRIVLKQSD